MTAWTWTTAYVLEAVRPTGMTRYRTRRVSGTYAHRLSDAARWKTLDGALKNARGDRVVMVYVCSQTGDVIEAPAHEQVTA